MKRILVFLLLFLIVFFVAGEKIAIFDDIYTPNQFKIRGDSLYIVDGYTIKLFSMKDFKFITQFGKKGEGPGEFKSNPRIMVFPDNVFVSYIGKILFFSRRGKFIKEKKSPRFTFLYKVKENFLSRELRFDRKKGVSSRQIKVLDYEFNEIKEMQTIENDRRSNIGPGSGKRNLEVIRKRKSIITDGNYIYSFDTNKGFYIEIYDCKGEKINTIVKDIKKIKVTKESKEEVLKVMKQDKKSWEYIKKNFNIIFPEYFPDIRFMLGDNKKLYVATYKTVNSRIELLILDIKGNILKKTFIPKKEHFLIHNNKFYYFIDNEDEEVWELHAVDL